MTRRIVELMALSVLALAVVATAACNIEDSGNTYAADAGGGGGEQVSEDPQTIPDDQVAVSGVVFDFDEGTPIQGAIISTEPPIGQIRTNNQGQYVFTAGEFPDLQPEKLFRFTATHPDYVQDSVQVLIKPGHVRNQDIGLRQAAADFTIIVSQTNLTFVDSDFIGDETITSKQVNLQLEGNTASTVSYSINIPPQAARWLSATPAEGQISGTPRFLTITVDKTGLANGVYNGTISIVAEGGLAEIQVTLNVGNAVDAPDDGNTDVPDDGNTDVPDDGNTDEPA